MVKFPSYKDIGYRQSYTVHGGILAQDYNQTYPVPCQIKFPGLYMKPGLSTDYDASATPAFPVFIPCDTDGEVPEGWSYMTTAITNLPMNMVQFSAPIYFNPPTDVLNVRGFATDSQDWVALSICPHKTGEKVGVPVKAGQDIVTGDPIAVAVGGFAKKAETGENVVGRAESDADNSATGAVDGAIFVAVKHIEIVVA